MRDFDRYEKNWIDYCIRSDGHILTLDKLLVNLDVSRHLPNGMRITNTKHFGYLLDLDYFEYVINDAIDKQIITTEQCIKYKNKLNNLIEKNIAYERENPPTIILSKGKAKSSTKSTRKVRSKDIFTGKTTVETMNNKGLVKETKADRIRNVLSAKSISFSFGNISNKNK